MAPSIPSNWQPGKAYVIDTGHLVTFDSHMKYQVKKVAGWKSTLFSGEGLVAELSGPGKLDLTEPSARIPSCHGVIPKLPAQRSSGN